jgi:nitrilase
VRSDNPERPTQTCFVYDELGTQLARYDKVHLFDVEIAASGERYQESAYTTPGTRAVVVDSPFGRLGLSVCYDLRFPELYRLLVDQGAQILFAPAAFTQATGAAHWELLCRARAVENLAWMVAPAQVGTHENGRETWGHSMLIDPWGKVHGELANGTGIAWADIDLAKVAQTRLQFPAIANRRINCEFG